MKGMVASWHGNGRRKGLQKGPEGMGAGNLAQLTGYTISVPERETDVMIRVGVRKVG